VQSQRFLTQPDMIKHHHLIHGVVTEAAIPALGSAGSVIELSDQAALVKAVRSDEINSMPSCGVR
jgi:hypothetical protein